MSTHILDLERVEDSLRAVQAQLGEVRANQGLAVEPLEDQVIRNIMHGYELVDSLVAEGTDVLAYGNTRQLLELNARVLCGVDPERRKTLAGHLRASEERFYDHPHGGIGALVDWYKLHQGAPVWDRAAGAFLKMVADPQLFIEGNHRTGVLFMTYLLLREGEPPFVLCTCNLQSFFRVSSAIAHRRRAGLAALFSGPRLRHDLADLLHDNAGICRDYLLSARRLSFQGA